MFITTYRTLTLFNFVRAQSVLGRNTIFFMKRHGKMVVPEFAEGQSFIVESTIQLFFKLVL
jgi:hypothetical protein